MTCTVRPATEADAEAVCALHGAAIREQGPAAYDDRQVSAWARGREPDDYPIGEPGVTFLVAERGGRVVGFGEVRPERADYFEAVPTDYGEIRAVYVHPEAARTGVGATLLGRLETIAREDGQPGVGLWASRNAVGFYEQHGYDRLGERQLEFGNSGIEATVIEMVTSL